MSTEAEMKGESQERRQERSQNRSQHSAQKEICVGDVESTHKILPFMLIHAEELCPNHPLYP